MNTAQIITNSLAMLDGGQILALLSVVVMVVAVSLISFWPHKA